MDLRNKAAARQAQSLYGSAAAKKPAAAIPPVRQPHGLESLTRGQAG